MRNNDMNKIIHRYNERLKKYGASQKTLGWDKSRSKLRFDILCSKWNLDNSSILDFGCGFGDLFGFLITTEVKNFTYLGIDINSELLSVAKDRYPEASFQDYAFFNDNKNSEFDYLFASGVFNDKIENNITFIENSFKLFNRIAKKGFAANFLSNKVDYREKHIFYSDPASILNLGYRFSNNIVLRNDYMPFEYTLFVDKSSKYNKKNSVYNEFLLRL